MNQPSAMRRSSRDVFLCHAHEDKEAIVRPFASELDSRGISYWLDEAEMKWGDHLNRSIGDGLEISRFAVVFLSASFLSKNWPQAELEAALTRENDTGETVVLPLVIGDARSILNAYPMLRSKLHLRWDGSPVKLVDQLARLLEKPPESVAIAARQSRSPTMADLFRGCAKFDLFSNESAEVDFEQLRSFEEELRALQADDATPVASLLSLVSANAKGPLQRFLTSFSLATDRITASIGSEAPPDGSLEIVSVDFTDNAELDVRLRNVSDDTVYITRIKVLLLTERGAVSPALQPTASYAIPIGLLKVGESRSLDVSHIIDPRRADRFLVFLDTTRTLQIRVTLEYNKRFSVSHELWTWRWED